MGMFLNRVAPYENYKAISSAGFFVDKTELIEEIIMGLGDAQKYICITRPRRFGKTVMANMIGAFFGKAEDASGILDNLTIAKSEFYYEHLNKHDLIYIDFRYIKDNVSDVQDDIALMFSGVAIPSDIHEYAASSMKLDTKDEIYSAMVIYGLLTYKDGYVSIPNRELMDSFAAMMKKEKSLGYINRLASASAKMLKATQTGDIATMTEILNIHMTRNHQSSHITTKLSYLHLLIWFT